MNEPEIVILADQANLLPVEAADSDRHCASADADECPRARGLGDDGRIDPGRESTVGWPHSPWVDAVPWAAVHVWWGDDRYVPRDHPQSNVKAFDDVLLDIADAEEGTAGAWVRPGARCRPRTSTRSRPARRSAAGQLLMGAPPRSPTRAGCQARGAGRLACLRSSSCSALAVTEHMQLSQAGQHHVLLRHRPRRAR